MAKLNPNQAPSGVSGPAVQKSEPENLIPFSVASVATAKKPRVKGDARERVLMVRGQAWFDAHFNLGHEEDVLNRRLYQAKGGFKCAACNIPGATAFVIKSKDGSGSLLDAVDADGKAVQINGYLVGYNCLRKYGKVDAAKIVRKAS